MSIYLYIYNVPPFDDLLTVTIITERTVNYLLHIAFLAWNIFFAVSVHDKHI